jgi:hypothetical protein
MPALNAWDSFYVIIGSAAGALIGLQFVVMTLIAARPPSTPEVGHAFSTPTVMHFVAVLLISALARVPWPSITAAAAVFGVLGIYGTGYMLVVMRRMRRQTAYRPDFEDWTFHALLPLLAYAGLAVAGYAAFSHMSEALFGMGAAMLVLLFSAIHNAWDATAFQVFVRYRPKDES